MLSPRKIKSYLYYLLTTIIYIYCFLFETLWDIQDSSHVDFRSCIVITTFPNSGHRATDPPGSWPHIGGHMRQTMDLIQTTRPTKRCRLPCIDFLSAECRVTGNHRLWQSLERWMSFVPKPKLKPYLCMCVEISFIQVKVIKEANFMRSQARRMSIVQRKWAGVRGDRQWVLRKHGFIFRLRYNIFKTNSKRI